MQSIPMILGPRSKAGLLIFLIASAALSAAYGLHIHASSIRTTPLNAQDSALARCSSDHRALWSIERLETSRHKVFIKGWAIVPGGTFSVVKSAFMLRDLEGGALYELRSYTYERLDVGQTYSPNHEDYLYNFDHDFAGISATADLGSLPKGHAFEVMIRFDGGQGCEIIQTDRVVGEGTR